MAALRHPNIVSFLGVCRLPPCVVSEYCSKGSLADVLRGARASPAKAAQLDWHRRLNMVRGLAGIAGWGGWGRLWCVRGGWGQRGTPGPALCWRCFACTARRWQS
jgi:hypothetical protein